MGVVIQLPQGKSGGEARRLSVLRPLVESNLRRLHVDREQHWAQALVDKLNRNVLADVPTAQCSRTARTE